MKKLILAFILFTQLSSIVWGVDYNIERRREQFETETSHYVFPFPLILPGIGTGLAVVGAISNFYKTADVGIFALAGDFEGGGIGLQEIPLYQTRLLLDYSYNEFSKVTFNNYSERGMDTQGDEFNIIELNQISFNYSKLTYNFSERLLDVYAISTQFVSTVTSIRDNEGELITELDDPDAQTGSALAYGTLLDYTDDRNDPRKGIRYDINRSQSPRTNSSSPDFYTVDHNITLYIPIGDFSTWVWNYFQSDAFVNDEGETNRTILAANQGLSCELITNTKDKAQCEKSVDDLLNNQVAANKNGTATSIGGRSRLRSYTESRFSGAHTAFYGTEFRWNLTDEKTPFDLVIMKDIRTSIQIAFFYETGSVAEISSELWQDSRYSAGAGFRLVMGSGIVGRFDFAFGEEGANPTIIFNYPWESF